MAVVRASSSDEDSNIPSSSSSPVPDALPVAGVDTDWRAFRARLVASSSGLATTETISSSTALPGETTTTSPSSLLNAEDDVWAHEITTLEPGCLLLASPAFFTHTQTYFSQAVILLADHSPSQGSYGFILNKPTEHRIAQVNSTGVLPEALNPCTLYLGGDVNKESVSVVHSVPGLQDTREVVPGVFLGGIHGLGRKMENGELTPPEVKIMIGMAGWGPGQLQEEVARGVWVVASASKHVILSASVAGAGQELWHATMQLMGGDYAGLSQALKETYRADVMEIQRDGDTTYSESSAASSTAPAPTAENNNNVEDGEEPRSGGGEPSSPSSSKGPWKPPRRDPGHNYGSGI
jgi:putative transcriptional regulator